MSGKRALHGDFGRMPPGAGSVRCFLPGESGWERILGEDEDGGLGQKDSEIMVLPPPK